MWVRAAKRRTGNTERAMPHKAYVPSMKDSAVKAKTGKNWKSWFALLDKAGAAKLRHTDIAELLYAKHGVPGWWSQMLTVEYELARGLRERHQTATGFSVSVTKTVAASLSKLYAAAARAEQRKKWLPKGSLAVSSQTKDKYVNGSWNKTARVNMGFYAKGAGKSQIAVQVNKLANKGDVDIQRAAWKEALARMQQLVEKPNS